LSLPLPPTRLSPPWVNLFFLSALPVRSKCAFCLASIFPRIFSPAGLVAVWTRSVGLLVPLGPSIFPPSPSFPPRPVFLAPRLFPCCFGPILVVPDHPPQLVSYFLTFSFFFPADTSPFVFLTHVIVSPPFFWPSSPPAPPTYLHAFSCPAHPYLCPVYVRFTQLPAPLLVYPVELFD